METTPSKRPLLVGELNPYGADPKYALYPLPEHSAGGRLCAAILGLSRLEYLRRFDRVNLCVGKWTMAEARKTAKSIRGDGSLFPGGERTVVLLGRKVATAFDLGVHPPFSVVKGLASTYVLLPHPSGLCREWNTPGAVDKARSTLREAGVVL